MNPYAVLSVGPRATPRDIKESFRRLSLRCHPDKGGDPQRFALIREAYELLSDPERRSRFDDFGAQEGPGVGDGFAAMVQCFEPLSVGLAAGLLAGALLEAGRPRPLPAVLGSAGLWACVAGAYALRPAGKRAVEALNFRNVLSAIAAGFLAGLLAGAVASRTLLAVVGAAALSS